jgi:NAD+ synthase (glutamine-hydrolysing)
MRKLRIALAQINTTVGNFAFNTARIIENIEKSRSLGVDIVTFPELAVCGYPPEDLLFKTKFIDENQKSLNKIISACKGITAIVGFVDSDGDIYNAAAIISDGKLVGKYHKIYLPNYGVFDENRYFQAGNQCPVYSINGIHIGVNICEDIWYEAGPPTIQALSGAELIVNISASPYHAGKGDLREKMVESRAIDNIAVVALNNLVGGQDELVFDGNSMIFNEKGKLLGKAKTFAEDMLVADIDIESVFRRRLHDPRWRKAPANTTWPVIKVTIPDFMSTEPKPPLPAHKIESVNPLEEIYRALVLGTHDYVTKNGFQKVVIGLSGGIDSSIVAAIAMDALGPENVIGVAMPSRYSSPGSIADAKMLAQNLGIKLYQIPFDKIYQQYLDTLAEPFEGKKPDVTEENIQARIRGNILMALSNKFGWLVLTTGNKSEYATGYTTLYGDMAGGFAVIKDVFKTMVYQLSHYCNTRASREVIPASIITKAPSAELRPDQKDTDSLPPYDLLDPILAAYVEEDRSIEEITGIGFSEEMVKKAARLVDISEYKRRQSPPGVKITPRAFGRDRRLPITNRFREYS